MSTVAPYSDATREDQQAGFSLELNQDQRDIRGWAHGFARDVIRPAAAEWDEREETPWPISRRPRRSASTGSRA